MAARKGTVDLNQRAQQQRALQQQGALPGITDPNAAGYAAGLEAKRRGGALPKSTTRPGGGDLPPMPALEHPHQPGMTMAQQAAATRRDDAQRHAQTAAATQGGSGSIIASDVQQVAPASAEHVASPEDMVLLPGDLLTPEAQKDPMFQAGAGSQVALSQPHMAAKYGVVRNGRKIPPHELVRTSQGTPVGNPHTGSKPQRSKEEMAADMRTAFNAGQAPQAQRGDPDEGPAPPEGLPLTDDEARAQAADGVGAAASRAGESPAKAMLSEEAMKAKLNELDDMDLDTIRREMIKDILKNPKQKEAVEARCKPLDIDSMIMHNMVHQRVPIIPGRFEPTYESMQGDVELALKRMLVSETKSVAVTESYLLDKYAVMTCAAGLYAINGNPLPAMHDAEGNFNEDMYWEKFNWVLKKPIHMIASIGIHYAWFEERCRMLFQVDVGKDG